MGEGVGGGQITLDPQVANEIRTRTIKDIHIETGVYIIKVKQPALLIEMVVRLEMTQITTCTCISQNTL